MSYSSPRIFFSWQSDTEDRTNRRFIHTVLTKVCQQLADTPEVEESPRVDSGMEGVAGSPEVASVMFQKIDTAAIFVGDMTLVGTIAPVTKQDEPPRLKRVPNPNVLTEMGYAAARLGWSRVITVMNEHHGDREELPFDVRNRRFPITYTMAPNDSPAAEKDLARSLTLAIGTALEAELQTARDALSRLDHDCHDLFERNADFPAWRSSYIEYGSFAKLTPENYAITRLIDLKLVEYRETPEREGTPWSYVWTYLGRRTIELWRQVVKGQKQT
jgi:hypothetical protein